MTRQVVSTMEFQPREEGVFELQLESGLFRATVTGDKHRALKIEAPKVAVLTLSQSEDLARIVEAAKNSCQYPIGDMPTNEHHSPALAYCSMDVCHACEESQQVTISWSIDYEEGLMLTGAEAVTLNWHQMYQLRDDLAHLSCYERFIETIRAVLKEHNVPETYDLLHSLVNTLQYSDVSLASPANEDSWYWALEEAKDAVLEYLVESDVIDRPGDCPVCGRSGWVGLGKHAACAQTLFRKASGLCQCGAVAVTLYRWTPFCTECQSHEEHLSMLYDD